MPPRKKRCTNCDTEKPLSEFYNRRRKSTHKNSHCKDCEHEQIIKWRQNNREKQAAINRRMQLKRNYGITPEQWDQLLAAQDGKCFVCQRHHTHFPRRLCVDHNHKTGEIRGLLCIYCNKQIVGRHRESTLLKRAAEYLDRQYTGWFVPDRRKRKRKRTLRKRKNV